MKKILIFFCFYLFLLPLAAQQAAAPKETDPVKTEVIQEKDKMVTLTIEFIPITSEARFIYTCPSGLFDQGEAMKTIKDRATAFTKERGYTFYSYARRDETKYDNATKTAIYTSYIQFIR